MPQGSVSGPLLFLVYVNDIWWKIDLSIRLFADNCIIYRKIINKNDIEKLQKEFDTLGEWSVENETKYIPLKVRQQDFRELRFKLYWGAPLVTKTFREREVVNTWE